LQKFGWDRSGFALDGLIIGQTGSCVNWKAMAHCDSSRFWLTSTTG
jgi:hypothetical protein